MGNLLTFREAGEQLGVDRSVLKKMLRDGNLPQAEKVRRSQGWVWVLPEDAISELRKHPDLVIDLSTEPAEARIEQTAELKVEVLSEEPTETEGTDQVSADNSVSYLSLASDNSDIEPRSVADMIDIELLDRLLAIQEAKTEASCRAEQSEYALEAAKTHYSSLEEELNIERQERSMTAEKLREERLARKVADVKIAELNEQLVRETRRG